MLVEELRPAIVIFLVGPQTGTGPVGLKCENGIASSSGRYPPSSICRSGVDQTMGEQEKGLAVQLFGDKTMIRNHC